MRDTVAGLALALLGMVNAVPSAAAVHPVAVAHDYIDDDLTGSGRETKEHGAKLPQRRHALRLRVRSARDRAALLRVIDEIPAVVAEYIPECADDPAKAALALQLIHALYEGRPQTVRILAARSALTAQIALRKLEQLQASGLVRLAPGTGRQGDRWVMPTASLRACGDDLVERLYYAFIVAVNGP
ncbi:MAG TPA: hypothetical protein VF502_01635 [Stellaceae bacterium]